MQKKTKKGGRAENEYLFVCRLRGWVCVTGVAGGGSGMAHDKKNETPGRHAAADSGERREGRPPRPTLDDDARPPGRPIQKISDAVD